MTDTIKAIQEKYKVPFEGARLIYEAASHGQAPLNVIVSLYKMMEHNGTRVDGTSLSNAIRVRNTSIAGAIRPVGTMDDRRTKNVVHKYDQTGNIRIVKDKFGNETKVLDQFRVLTDENGNKVPVKPTFISTRRMLAADNYKEEFVPREIPPKYYYFDIDLKFNQRGYDQSPSYDNQFDGYGKDIPYARVTVKKIISPSKYPVPKFDEAGNLVGREKTRGSRILNVDIFFRGHSKEFELIAPYEHVTDFDTIKGVEITRKIHDMIKIFMTPRVIEFYQAIKSGKKIPTVMTMLKQTTQLDKDRKDMEKFEEFYGNDYKERKKRSVKSLSKRNTIKKKVTKQKCVCPTPSKRKLVSIKKKLIRKKRK